MKANLLIIILLAFLLTEGHGQRGGSRHSSSESQAEYHSKHRPVYHSTPQQPTRCTTENGTTTCYYDEQSNEGSILGFVIVVAIFGALAIYGYLQQTKNAARRKAIVLKAFNDFQARMQEYPSLLDESSQNALIDQLMSKSYTMVINVKDKSEKFFCQVTIKDLHKQTNNRYLLKLEGKDEVGTSKLDGIMVFREKGLACKLSKVYDDRSKAQQTGDYQILLYEGLGTPEKMEGQWAFHGFENSLEYSGNWIMMQL